jgi:hypothetical protein
MPKIVEQKKTITAQNTFTEWAQIKNIADLSISGVSDSTITAQRTLDGGTTIKDIENFTADAEKVINGSVSGTLYRVGIKTGNYGSDTVLVEISQ